MFFKWKATLSRTASWDILLEVEDEVSGLQVFKISTSHSNFAKIITREIAMIDCNCQIDNYDKVWKIRQLIRIPYPSWIIWKDVKNKWIQENTPKWFTYHSDSNYWKIAVFIKFT